MLRTLVVVALASAMSLAATPALLADTWYEHYLAAEKALANGEWRQAVDQINRALEKKGDSGVRVRTYGMKFTSYFPYLKLGIAYYELGELDAALQAFETEEQLGAIADSADDVRELARYRGVAVKAREDAEKAEAERIAEIVRDSIVLAKRLESEGRLEEAVRSLGNALAVAPDDAGALAMLSRLRSATARRLEEADRAKRSEVLMEAGRGHLAAGRLEEAASVLSQALSLMKSDEVRNLLAEAQQGLRRELEREALESGREARREEKVAQVLQQALDLEAGGEVAAALDRLQSVLALEPTNARAVALESRLLEARANAARERQRRETITELLAAASSARDGGQAETAVEMANRALGLDPANQRALELLASSYRTLNDQLLGGSPRQNVPPAISFVDSRQERGDGSLAQLVRRPDFLLSGIVIDDSPVTISFFDAAGEEIDASHRSRALGDLYVTEFQISRRLAAGATTLRLVASDAEGLSSSSEYEVVYERPFLRSPVFVGSMAGFVVVLAAGAVVVSLRRRRQLRRRRFNPYMAGSPVLDAKLFFGRAHLLDRILQTLHNNSLLLHGERRIGKTSLQHHLKRRLEELEDPAFKFYPVFIDLQGTPEERFFATLAEEVFTELEPALEGLRPGSPLSGEYTYRSFVKDLRRILRRLRDRDARQARLVLLIDEVDELNSYDPRVNQKLRSLFMKSFAENLVAVVSGVAIKREWDREGSPWYNFFEEIDVGPIEPDVARELIERPVHGVIDLEKAAVDRILEVTECRPYQIQKLCMNLVNHVYEKGGHRITVADVDAMGSPAGSVVP